MRGPHKTIIHSSPQADFRRFLNPYRPSGLLIQVAQHSKQALGSRRYGTIWCEGLHSFSVGRK